MTFPELQRFISKGKLGYLLLPSAAFSAAVHWSCFNVPLSMSSLLHATATSQHKVKWRQMKEKETII